MWLHSLTIATILMGGQIVSLAGKNLNINVCTNKETIAVKIFTSTSAAGLTCQCLAGPSKEPEMKEDYVYTPGVGSHKLHTHAKTWNQARRICYATGGHLAIINSREEETILMKMLHDGKKKIIKAVTTAAAFVGLHDQFREGDWLTLFNEPIETTGYVKWTTRYGKQEPDNYQGNQNCATLVVSGGLDDAFCHERHAFFCELPLFC